MSHRRSFSVGLQGRGPPIRISVVVLNDFAYVDGGASKIALGSAKALARRGHPVLLFAAVPPVDPSLSGVSNLEVRCLHQHEIVADPSRVRAAVQGIWNLRAAAELRKSLAAFEPANTIIHLHTWTKALSASVVRMVIGLGFRLVITLHDYFSVCPTGSLFIHPHMSICHLKPMSWACIRTDCDSRNYSHKLWRVGRHWMQNHPGQLHSDALDYICVSDLSEELHTRLLPSGARIHRVPNFIEVEAGTAAEVGRNREFSFVGRQSPEKGPLLLAECARRLDLDVKFIGDGPLNEELREMAPRATFTGWLSAADTRRNLLTSRALVFPSLYYEAQGLVVAEAAAMGIPAIVPSTSAAREWIVDGVTGLLFDGGDVDDLARKIVFLRDHPEAAAAMGTEAYRRYWLRPATLSRHCEALEKVYAGMLEAKPEKAVRGPEGA